jgi:hypothetical protein
MRNLKVYYIHRYSHLRIRTLIGEAGPSHARLHETIKMRKVRFLRSLSFLSLILGHPHLRGVSPLNIIVKN